LGEASTLAGPATARRRSTRGEAVRTVMAGGTWVQVTGNADDRPGVRATPQAGVQEVNVLAPRPARNRPLAAGEGPHRPGAGRLATGVAPLPPRAASTGQSPPPASPM